MSMFPLAVASTGPATTFLPVAAAVSLQSNSCFIPPPTKCKVATGLPVIVSNTGGLPETVVDTKTGFLVEPANPRAIAERLQLIYETEDYCLELGKAGRNYTFRKYSWNNTAPKMIEIYKSVFGS